MNGRSMCPSCPMRATPMRATTTKAPKTHERGNSREVPGPEALGWLRIDGM